MVYVGDHLTLLHIKYVSCGSHGFKDVLSISHYKSMGVTDHRDMASLDPRGLISTIYLGDN